MRESASPEMRKLACPRRLAGAVSERARSGLGSRSALGPLARQRRGFAGFELRGRRSFLARLGADFAAGAALSQGQVFPRIELRGRCNTFESSGADFVAGASLSQGQVQNSWQAQHFRKVKCKIRGRRITFARSSANFMAGAALSQGPVSTFAAGARKSQLLSTKVVREVNFRSRGLKIVTFKYESSTRSPLSQPGLENRNI